MEKKIFGMLVNSNEPISNRDLALNCKVSINTIRKEISLLNDELSKHGICIVSQPSIGNYIEILDSVLAMQYITSFKDKYKRNKRINSVLSDNGHYIVRKYLSSSHPFTIDTLCEELYCSKGTILKDIKLVKEYLKQFNLNLHNRNRSGLIVEGSEWNIRQCLIHQHKILKNTIQVKYDEPNFRGLFLEKIDNFSKERTALIELISNQNDFSIPMIYYPKIIHYMQLCYTRKKYRSNIEFTEEQINRAINTKEYEFAKKLYFNFCERLNFEPSEQDVLGLSMLLLSYESQNNCIQELKQYQEYYQETIELIDYLKCHFGCIDNQFDELFIKEWITHLYTLQNRLIFNVYVDREAYVEIEKKGIRGIRSTDFCIVFANLYFEKHGIKLKKEEAITAFYIFHRILKVKQLYYAQNVLVISHYGKIRAENIAKNIKLGYGREVKNVTAIELGEKVDNLEDYDILMTDVGVSQFHYLKRYDLPIISLDFSFNYRCMNLDDYIKKVRQRCELEIINDGSFEHSRFRCKEDLFNSICDFVENGEELYKHLQSSDEFVDLEKNHGIVFIPVLSINEQQIFKVYINDEPFIWNNNESQIFVCYNRANSFNANQILNSILERFVHISLECAENIKKANDNYLSILYGNEMD